MFFLFLPISLFLSTSKSPWILKEKNYSAFRYEIIFIQGASTDITIMEIALHANVHVHFNKRNCFNGNANVYTV